MNLYNYCDLIVSLVDIYFYVLYNIPDHSLFPVGLIGTTYR